MVEFLEFINKSSLAIELVALIIYISFRSLNTPKGLDKVCFPWIVVFMCITSIIHLGIELSARKMFGIESLYDYGVLLWYLGFAITDFVFVIGTILFCEKLQLKKDFISSTVLFCFAFLGLIQIVRYVERYVLEIDSDLMGWVYTNSIVMVNILTTTGVCFYSGWFAMKSISSEVRSKGI